MDTGKTYYDSEGNECSVWQVVRREPDWAASRLQVGEKAIERMIELEKTLKKILDDRIEGLVDLEFIDQADELLNTDRLI